MLRHTAVIIGLFFVGAATASERPDERPTKDPQQHVNALVEQLRRSDVQRIEILAISAHMETPVAIKPNDIETQPDYRLSVRDVRQGLLKEPLLRALTSLTVQRSSDGGDIRWAILFFDTRGQRIAEMFFNRDGTRGVLDSVPVSANGRVVKWLNAMFSECLP
jgi:hypothetical protein